MLSEIDVIYGTSNPLAAVRFLPAAKWTAAAGLYGRRGRASPVRRRPDLCQGLCQGSSTLPGHLDPRNILGAPNSLKKVGPIYVH